MGTDFQYAKNYWRDLFVRRSKGEFTRADFDKWYAPRKIRENPNFAPAEGEYEHGSRENRALLIHDALRQTLEQAAKGRFGRPGKLRKSPAKTRSRKVKP